MSCALRAAFQTPRCKPLHKRSDRLRFSTCEALHGESERRAVPGCAHFPHPGRRETLLEASALLAAACIANARPAQAAEPAVTHKVFLDIGMCAEGLNRDRRMGDKSALCADAKPVGRLTLALYGSVAPQTVANFVGLIEKGVYTGTVFHKVYAGRYIQAGRQGSKRYGRVDSRELAAIPDNNPDLVSSAAFSLTHAKPGTLSLCIGANDDDPVLRTEIGYHNAEFLITTGPGPGPPELDGENVVFGRVVDGFDTLATISAVPTIKPSESLERFNAIASLIGDDRAAKAKQTWGSPLQAVIITSAGVL